VHERAVVAREPRERAEPRAQRLLAERARVSLVLRRDLGRVPAVLSSSLLSSSSSSSLLFFFFFFVRCVFVPKKTNNKTISVFNISKPRLVFRGRIQRIWVCVLFIHGRSKHGHL
jgi:hypothetical protein